MRLVVLAVCAAMLLISCGNESSTTTTSQDTVTAAPAARADAGISAPADTRDGMKSAMNKMMSDIKGYNPTGDPDHDFAAIMRMHHQGAVDMMQAYLPGASDTMLRSKAQTGITKQQSEIQELDKFLNSHQPADKKSEYGKNAQQMVLDMMKMEAMPDNADKAFVQMMVPHHESAVHISQMFASAGKDAKLKEMARKIATDQQKEAGEMKKWMQTHP